MTTQVPCSFISLTTTDPALLKEFLLTHRSFTKDGLELMAALKTRYESAEEATGSVEEAAVIKFKCVSSSVLFLTDFQDLKRTKELVGTLHMGLCLGLSGHCELVFGMARHNT